MAALPKMYYKDSLRKWISSTLDLTTLKTMDKELHIRVTGDAHAKLKQLSKINNVTMSDAVRYVINHHFHKEELPNYDDAWVAIVPYMGALAVAPYYFGTRREAREQFPKALNYVNLRELI